MVRGEDSRAAKCLPTKETMLAACPDGTVEMACKSKQLHQIPCKSASSAACFYSGQPDAWKTADLLQCQRKPAAAQHCVCRRSYVRRCC